MKKKLFAMFILIIGFALLTACSSSNDSSNGSAEEGDSFYSKLKDSGVVRVGSTPTGPPFTFLNTETNEIDGLMVDIANAIGEKIGLEMQVEPVQFSSLIPSINSNKIDMIAAGMLITDERKEQIDFSQPVYEYGEALVVSNDNNEIQTFDDLEGKKVGVQEGTVYLAGLGEYPEIESQSYKSIADMIDEIENGRIDAFYGDYPIVQNMLIENPDFGETIKIVETYEPKWVGEIGIGFPKGASDFEAEINKAIDELKESGELEELINKWQLN